MLFTSLLLAFVAHAHAHESPLQFRYALLGDRAVYLQAESRGSGAIPQFCGESGAGCACDFLDSDGLLLGTTGPGEIAYDDRAEYLRCAYGSGAPRFAMVRVRTADDTIRSEDMEVTTGLTLPQLIGGHDINRVRSIYRYSCSQNYLEKAGTTTQAFDCSYQATECAPGSNFCLLQARFPYHLYSDAYSSNFHERIPERFYGVPGLNLVCGLQIRRFDCADEAATPTQEFGLYGRAEGIWQLPVTLAPNPESESELYGFAAAPSALTGECPPGLVKRVVSSVAVDSSVITPSHNMPSGLVATEVNDPAATLEPFHVSRWQEGRCDGVSCALPVSYGGDARAPQGYAVSGRGEFCVVPASLLP